MRMHKRSLRVAGLFTATGLAAVGLTFAASVTTAVTASAAGACTATVVSEYEGWNQNCTYAQIWNKVPSVGTIYGSRVGPQLYTSMTLCYANVSSYGINKGVKTGVV
jgi:invasion protein IalB